MLIDKIAKRVAHYVVQNHIKEKMESEPKIKGISEDISVLKQLKDELVKKEQEIQQVKIEWDKTFDAIIDSIVIINKDNKISKANKSFSKFVEENDGPYKTLVGMDWTEYKSVMNIDYSKCIVNECFNTGLHQEGKGKHKNRTYSILVNPIFDENHNVISVVRVSRDITHIEMQRQKIDRKKKVFESVVEMCRTLVNHNEWDKAVDIILKELGESIGAHRVYMFKNELIGDKICALLQSIWMQDGINCPTNEKIIDCINYDHIPIWRDEMMTGKTVEGAFAQCSMCQDKNMCMEASDFTVCAVPVFTDNQWWGFIGFDYPNRHHWRSDDETMLRLSAEIIGGVIHHRSNTKTYSKDYEEA